MNGKIQLKLCNDNEQAAKNKYKIYVKGYTYTSQKFHSLLFNVNGLEIG